jgi:hypothetical protein
MPASYSRHIRKLEDRAMLLILLLVVAAVAAFFILTYNSLVRLRVQSENAWSDIDVQLKRRYDLIPNWSKPSKLRRALKGR